MRMTLALNTIQQIQLNNADFFFLKYQNRANTCDHAIHFRDPLQIKFGLGYNVCKDLSSLILQIPEHKTKGFCSTEVMFPKAKNKFANMAHSNQQYFALMQHLSSKHFTNINPLASQYLCEVDIIPILQLNIQTEVQQFVQDVSPIH